MPSTPTDDVAEAVISAQQILVKRSATEFCKKRYLISDWTEGVQRRRFMTVYDLMLMSLIPLTWDPCKSPWKVSDNRSLNRTHSQEQFERRFLWRKLFKMPWPLRERFCEKVVKGEFREPLLSPTLAWRTVNYKMILKEHEGLICITMMLTMTMMRVSHSYSNDFSGVYTVSIVDYVPLGSYWNRFWKSQNVHHQWRTSRLIRESTYNRPLWRIIHSDSLKNRWRFFFLRSRETDKFQESFRAIGRGCWEVPFSLSHQPHGLELSFHCCKMWVFCHLSANWGPGISNGPFSLSQLFFDVLFFWSICTCWWLEMCFRVSCCSQVGCVDAGVL